MVGSTKPCCVVYEELFAMIAHVGFNIKFLLVMSLYHSVVWLNKVRHNVFTRVQGVLFLLTPSSFPKCTIKVFM